jgi:hypothetical protein
LINKEFSDSSAGAAKISKRVCPSFVCNKPLYAGDSPPENKAIDVALALRGLVDEEVSDIAADTVLVCNSVAFYNLL